MCVCVHKIYGGLEMIHIIMEVPVCNIEVGLPHKKKEKKERTTKKNLNCVEVIMDVHSYSLDGVQLQNIFFAN